MAGIGEVDSRGISAAPPIGAFAAKLLDYGKEIDARSRQEKSDAEAQRRWDITNNRAEEVYQRQLLDQKATDAANAELAKGPQVYGGALNTQVAIDQANANSFTPEEIKKYDMYKDSKTARAAGENALADKMDWQTNLSNVADTLPGSGAANESRVQMYEGVMARLAKQGLPVPPSVIASADQARLFEAQETAATLKENSEAQAKNSADQIANAKYMVANAFGGNSGQQAVTDENGTVVGYAPSAAINRNNKSTNSYMDDVAKGSTGIIKAVTGLGVKDGTPTAVDAVDLYKEILANDPTIDPGALQTVIEANVGKDPTTFFGLFGGKNAALKQDNIQKLTSSIKNTRVPTADVTTVSSNGSTKSEEAAKLSSQISTQQAGTAQQLRDERAKILRGADGRREDRVNEILMNAGLVKRPEVSQDTLTSVKAGSDGVRADRNNNPGNITGDDNWEGKSGKDGRFVQFKTYADGSRALAKNLKNAAVGQTVQEYMSKYAPKSDNNDTDAYIKNVSDKLGIKPGDKISDEHVWPLMQAIARQEGGKVDIEGLKAGYERVYPTAIKTKADEILEKTEEGKTVGESKVVDLFNKSDLTKDGINKEDILNRNSSAPLIDVKAEEDLKNINWYNPIEKAKVRSSLINRGYSGDDADNMISTILKEKAEKTRSDNLIADRNYRAAKITGSKFDGKTAEEWNELRSTKNRIGDYGFLAPIAAAAAPIAATIGTLYGGATAVSGMGGTSLAGTVGREVAVKALRKKSVDITKDISRSKQEFEKIRETILSSKRKPSEDLIKKQDDLAEYIARANKELEDISKVKDYALNTKTKPGAADKALDELLRRYDINARPSK